MWNREINAHVPEHFWYIHVSYKAADGTGCEFTWDRGHMFDKDAAIILYEACVEDSKAVVKQVSPFGSLTCLGDML
jgi:DNA topoisomerase-3